MRIIRKIFAALLVAANFPVVYAATAEISSVRIDGIYESYQYVKAVSDSQADEYTWYIADNANEFGESAGVGSTLFITSDMANKYLSVAATDSQGNVIRSDAEKIAPKLSSKCDTYFWDLKKTTPEGNKFYIDGNGYILLDTTKSDSSHFLVMTDDVVGTRLYSSDNDQLFTDMCAFLNNKTDEVIVYSYDEEDYELADDYTSSGYRGNSSYTQLPDVILSHIDDEHIWKQEPTKLGWYSKTEIGMVGGIAIPSLDELKKYSDKIGVTESFWLRTPRGLSGSGKEVLYVSAENRGEIGAFDSKKGQYGIRPIFYLDKSFFADVAIPVTDMGDNVKREIRNTYSREELENTYSDTDLDESLGYPGICSADNIELKNKYGVTVLSPGGSELHMNFDLLAGKNGFDGTVRICGETGEVSEGVSLASGERNSMSVPLTFDTVTDETINFSLIDAQGDTVFTKDIKSESISAYIDGASESCETYNTLKIKYNPAIKSTVSTQWQLSDSADGTYTDIAEGRGITVKSEYAEKYIRAKVTAADGTSEVTESVYVKSAYKRQLQFSADDTIKTQRLAPKENMFSVDGQEFILLDTRNSEESRFLVLSAKSLKKTAYLGGSANEDYSSMHKYINGDFLNEGYISQSIINHVDESAVWKCEPRKYPLSNNEETVFIGGFAVPSVTEYKQYIDKINVYDEMGWWTRTPEASQGGPTGIIAPSGDFTQMGIFYLRTYEELGIRPIFWLDRNFFAAERIDIYSLGDNVRDAIFNTYEKSELEDIYTADEIDTIFDKGNITFSLEPLLDANNPYIHMKFRKNTDEAIDYKIGLETNDGESFYSNVTFPEGIREMEYDFPIERLSYGKHDVTVYAEVDGKRTHEKTSNMTFMPFYKKQFMDNVISFRGYCDSIQFTDETAAEYFKASGANAVRNGNVEWHQIEKEKGVYDFTKLDKVVENILNMGSEPTLLLCYSNELYMPSDNNGNKNGPNTKESMDAFAKMAAAVAARYPQVKYFEIYNEPNLEFFWQPWHNYEDYAYLAKITGEEIKKVSPDAVVVGGAVGEDGFWFLRNIYEKNVYPYVDAMSFHPYVFSGGGRADGQYQTRLNNMLAPSRSNGGFKTQLITEIGWPNCTHEYYGCTEETQAIENVKQYIYNDINSIAYTASYNFVDCGYDETEKEHRFGVIDPDGRPKMSYASTSALFRMLGGAVYYGDLFTKSNVVSALYSKNGEPLGVFWNSANGGNSEDKIELSFPNEHLTIYDINGNKILENVSTFSVDKKPVYVTGFSKETFLSSFKYTYSKKIDSLLKNAGLSKYSYLFDLVKERVQKLDKISDKREATDILKSHLRIADNAIYEYKNKLIECDFEKLVSILNVVYESSSLAEGYLQVVSNDYSRITTAQERIDLTEEYIAERKSGISGARLPYAEAVLKTAKLRLAECQEVEEIEESNPQKNGVIRAWRQKAWLTAQLAARIAEVEEVTHDDIIVHSASGDKKATTNAGGTLETAVYNYGSTRLDAVVRVRNESGTILGSSDVSLNAGANAMINIELAASSDVYAYIDVVENGVVIQSEHCVISQ